MIGSPVSASSHVTAELCKQLLLRHHVSFLQARYLKRIFSMQHNAIKLCSPFLKTGYHAMAITKLFEDQYDCDVWSNDLDVLHARVCWVQRHETRRGICSFYGI